MPTESPADATRLDERSPRFLRRVLRSVSVVIGLDLLIVAAIAAVATGIDVESRSIETRFVEPPTASQADPAIAVLEAHPDCLTGAAPQGKRIERAVIRRGDRVVFTKDVDTAIKVVFGEIEHEPGYSVVAFCYTD